jgi:hypothetical protein
MTRRSLGMSPQSPASSDFDFVDGRPMVDVFGHTLTPFVFLYHYGIKATVLYSVGPCRLHRLSSNRNSIFESRIYARRGDLEI